MKKDILSVLCIFFLLLQLCATEEVNIDSVNETIFNQYQNSSFDEETVLTKDNSTKEEDSEMTLLDLEKSMKKILDGMFNKVFSLISGGGLPPKASTKCLFSLARIYFGINRLEPWAFKSK